MQNSSVTRRPCSLRLLCRSRPRAVWSCFSTSMYQWRKPKQCVAAKYFLTGDPLCVAVMYRRMQPHETLAIWPMDSMNFLQINFQSFSGYFHVKGMILGRVPLWYSNRVAKAIETYFQNKNVFWIILGENRYYLIWRRKNKFDNPFTKFYKSM